MSVLNRKLLRDLRAQRGTSIAVAIVMTLGVMLYVASAGAYRDLSTSYASTQQKLALAGLHLALVGPVTPEQLAEVRALPGVAIAEPRELAELPVVPTQKAQRRVALRVLALPDEGAPQLDKVLVLDGAQPGPGEVLLEKHFAEHHGLKAGAVMRVGADERPLKVSGVAVSAEYLWVARDENDFLTIPDEFGVGWMRRGSLESIAADVAPLAHQLLVEPAAGVEPGSLGPELRRVLGAGRVQHLTKAKDLVGVKLLQLDLDGYQGMAAFFPLFFLGVGAFIMGSALARMVDSQRPLVGTFRALGLSRGAVLRHYVLYALVLGGGGAVLGLLLGVLTAPAMTKEYAVELNIPFVETAIHPDLLGWGLLMAVVVSVLAGLLPAVRAMRLVPAAAMRAARPTVSAPARWLRKLPAPLTLRLALRDVVDRPLRSLGTLWGVAAALVLVLSTGVLLDSMRATFGSLFTDAIRYDARVDFATPVRADDVEATARGIPGVVKAQALLVLPARLEANGKHTDVLLQALATQDGLLRSVDADGTRVPPAPGGLVLTRAAAKNLGVSPGDALRVTAPGGGAPSRELRLTGFADAAMGPVATMRKEDLPSGYGLESAATAVVVTTGSDEVRATLVRAFPSAARVQDTAATRALFDKLLGLGWLMIGFMLVLGGVLAGAILFNTATLLVLERQRELASLRALGLRMREVVAMITAQHAVLAVLGLAVGLPLSALASWGMLQSFSNELFALPFVLRAPTVLVALVGTFGVVLLAQWPALRRISRSSLAEAVRERG